MSGPVVTDGPPDPALSLGILGAHVDGAARDILVAGGIIAAVLPAGEGAARLPASARRIDGRRRAALPGLMNAHTHTAMAMLRGYADDMPLLPWLREKIWPLEARLVEEDVYWGARLGCLEMIRTGTTFFNDMYWHFHATARAAADSGLRALVGGVIIDQNDPKRAAAQREMALAAVESVERYGPRVRASLSPHAIYTVGEGSLRWVAETATTRGLPVHIHLSETAREVADCIAAHGMRPPAWLDHVGLLNEGLFAAHCVHLDAADIALLAERGAHPLHNPVSNLKLASGGPMPYRALRQAGVRALIGTDGAASNNNLDLLEELKFAALMAKHATGDPTAMTAGDALSMATTDAAAAFGIDGGRIAPGAVADLILVDLDHPLMFPGHDLAADLVYAAHGRAVRTTICDGRVLMDDGHIPDEELIRAEVRARLNRLLADA
jgi:5-methylthioadenosine/S-adenosylhomocysteine deaminase